ncbi:tyrosine kinase [Stieleria maiorica]|uniref:Tyrosine kinase n=2 Tax=Stieleria maiorica TaxID=2795974 RepID=A0A5B9MME4_9BACT|nr:tyrosine kinase [Stieleria maiorica]
MHSAIGKSFHRGIPEFSDLMLACRHHAVLTFVVGSVFAVSLALAAWTMIRPNYHAEALVRVREKSNVVFAPQTSRAEDIAFFRSQAALVRSHQVLSAAFDDEEVRQLPDAIPEGDRVEWLDGLLRVETQSGSEVISITVHHESPQVAQAYCNAITRAYLDEITHRIASDRRLRETQLEQAVAAADAQLDALWDELNSVARSVGSDSSESLTIRDEMQFQSYRDYAQQLQAAQLRGNQLQSQLEEYQANHGGPSTVSDEVVEKLLRQNAEIIAARKQLLGLELQCQQMQKIAASAESPQMRRLTDQRDLYAGELEELVNRTRAEISETLQIQAQSERQQSLAKLKQQIELNRSEKEYLRERMTELNSVVSRTTPKTAVPLDMSRHAVERQSRLADGLWKALQEFRIESQSQPRVALQSLATLPEQANHSRQLRAAAVSGVGGWMLVMFMIGYLEWRDCRVRSARDLISRSAFPVFGTNAYAASQPKSWFGRRQKHVSGGVREAAARIILRNQDASRPVALMVSSCIADEPRHLISQELVMLLGNFGRRALLVDCDTDRSQLSHALGAAQSPGIRQLSVGSESLSAEAITERLIATNQSAVDFLPIGTMADDQTWIDPRMLRAVVAAMRQHYDAIIINGPSIMGSAEGALLAEEVDSSVIAVFVDHSRWNQLVLCEQSAAESGIPLSGSILHPGTGKPGLRLNPDQKPVLPNRSLAADGTESETALQMEIGALQEEIRRVQADGDESNQQKTSPDVTNHTGKATHS